MTQPQPLLERPARPGRPTRGRAPRWVGLVPYAILAVGAVMLLAVTELNIIDSTLGSAQAIGIAVGIGVGFVLLAAVVLPRLVANDWARSGILSVIALVVVWLLVVPYFDDTEVHEVRAGFPTSETGRDASRATPSREPDTSAPTSPAATAPVLVSSGTFVGDDHDASGTVNLFREADGGHVVQLLGIDIEGVPDPFVHLVPGVDRTDPDGGRDLGGLRANQGDLFYDLPADLDPATGDWTFLVWCRAFAVPIAHATLTPA